MVESFSRSPCSSRLVFDDDYLENVDSFALTCRRTSSSSHASMASSKRSTHRSKISTGVNEDTFDVHAVHDSFVAALKDPTDRQSPIGTQDYINGYRELLK